MICGKKIFNSQTEAKEAVRGFNQSNKFRQGGKNRSKRSPTKAYFCKDCNAWHLHTEGKKKTLSQQTTVKLNPHKKKDYEILHVINNCRIPIK